MMKMANKLNEFISYLQEQVKIAFDEADINIPYPQMDIHMVK